MTRFRILIAVFFLALSIPLTFFVWRTYRGLEQEETATLQFFAATLFDEMESALAEIVRREESRAIDAYAPDKFTGAGRGGTGGEDFSSQLRHEAAGYILGYFQNNPDGSFQSPLTGAEADSEGASSNTVDLLRRANAVFNTKRVGATDSMGPPASFARKTAIDKQAEEAPRASLADRYLDTSRLQRSKSALGQQAARYERVAPRQAIALSEKKTAAEKPAPGVTSFRSRSPESADAPAPAAAEPASAEPVSPADDENQRRIAGKSLRSEAERSPSGFQVEVAPLQAVFIDGQQIYVFRRIMFNGQIYRQGFVLKVREFLTHLIETYFVAQPMARFTRLRLQVAESGRVADTLAAGAPVGQPSFVLDRTFPSPFGFLSAQLICDAPPPAASRQILNVMVAVLTGIFVIGTAAIYKSVLTVVEHSRRRSQFVSAVTHELKTPLTNIRMYIEMLEQGMARTPEKESEYYRIVNSEGDRLSRLINNVLELSKLERRQRVLEKQLGDLSEVIAAAREAMQVKLDLEGFELELDLGRLTPFAYDREAMVQIMINLIENSVKFGGSEAQKRITIRTRPVARGVSISVSDTGPGIPRGALKKIFEEFYRVDNSLTRTTRGTGIGLALVKKLVQLMGGTVAAGNNSGPGCTITIFLPTESTAPAEEGV